MTPSPMIASLVGRFMITTLHEKARDCSRAVTLGRALKIRLSRSEAMAGPSRKMANRSGNAQWGILPSGGSPPYESRLVQGRAPPVVSMGWSKDTCESSLLMRRGGRPPPPMRPITHMGGGGPEGVWNCGFRARLTSSGDVAAKRKMANRSGDAQWGILPNGCSRPY